MVILTTIRIQGSRIRIRIQIQTDFDGMYGWWILHDKSWSLILFEVKKSSVKVGVSLHSSKCQSSSCACDRNFIYFIYSSLHYWSYELDIGSCRVVGYTAIRLIIIVVTIINSNAHGQLRSVSMIRNVLSFVVVVVVNA